MNENWDSYMKTLIFLMISSILFGCTSNGSSLRLHPSIDLNEPIPAAPVFNKSHKIYLDNKESKWGKFAKLVYDKKSSFNSGVLRKLLLNEGLSNERIDYLFLREGWARAHCEVSHLQMLAADEELKSITNAILDDIQTGGDYSSYWKIYKREEKMLVVRGYGHIQALEGKKAIAVKYKKIVDQLYNCVSNVVDPTMLKKR